MWDWADREAGCDAANPMENSRAGKALEVVLNEAGSRAFAPLCGLGRTKKPYDVG